MTQQQVTAPAALAQPQNRLLALDQASRVTGWAVFIDNELKGWGHLTTNQDEVGERLVQIREFIINKVQQWDINKIAFEDIQLQSSVGNNVKTFKVLANVYGVVLETAVELNKSFVIVPSSTWKSSLQIKGRSRPDQKKNAQQFVLQQYKVKATQDECDAICIGTYVCGGRFNRPVLAETAKNDGFDWSE